MVLSKSPEIKKRLSESLVLFHDALKTYGKQPDQLEAVTKLFIFALADYTEKQIVDAMVYYTKNYSDFPAPADIVQIIERGNKPPFEKVIYLNICKKDGEDRTREEWDYKRDYEKWNLKG